MIQISTLMQTLCSVPLVSISRRFDCNSALGYLCNADTLLCTRPVSILRRFDCNTLRHIFNADTWLCTFVVSVLRRFDHKFFFANFEFNTEELAGNKQNGRKFP